MRPSFSSSSSSSQDESDLVEPASRRAVCICPVSPTAGIQASSFTSKLTSIPHTTRHKSIIAYLSANNLPNAAAALRVELNLNEDVFDGATSKKYETLLEKKWTSVVRLQKKACMLFPSSPALSPYPLPHDTEGLVRRRMTDHFSFFFLH